MQTRTFEITGDVDVQYDEHSAEFQEALEGYIDMIDSDGTAESMVKHVAMQMQSWGDHEHMVEAVGYVGLIGQPLPEKDYCGIQISADYGQLEYD